MAEHTVKYPEAALVYQNGVLFQIILPGQGEGPVRFFVDAGESFDIVAHRDTLS